MAKQILKAFATEPDNMNFIPWTQMVEGKNKH